MEFLPFWNRIVQNFNFTRIFTIRRNHTFEYNILLKTSMFQVIRLEAFECSRLSNLKDLTRIALFSVINVLNLSLRKLF